MRFFTIDSWEWEGKGSYVELIERLKLWMSTQEDTYEYLHYTGKKITKTMQFEIVWASKKILKGETNNERKSAHGAKYWNVTT